MVGELRLNAISGRRLFGLAYLQYGSDDLVIAGATAEVAGQGIPDLGLGRIRILVK